MLRAGLLSGVLAVFVTAGLAEARPALRDNSMVVDTLVAYFAAKEIQEECNAITPRWARVLTLRNSLLHQARAQGYSESEIDAFVDSKTEQKRLESIARTWLVQNGALKGDAASHCAVGRVEIEKNSLIGSLLKAK